MNEIIDKELLEQDCNRIKNFGSKNDKQTREDVYDKVCDMIDNLSAGNRIVHTESVDIAYLTADLVMKHFGVTGTV